MYGNYAFRIVKYSESSNTFIHVFAKTMGILSLNYVYSSEDGSRILYHYGYQIFVLEETDGVYSAVYSFSSGYLKSLSVTRDEKLLVVATTLNSY